VASKQPGRKCFGRLETRVVLLVGPRDTTGRLSGCSIFLGARKAELQGVVAREAGKTLVGHLYVPTKKAFARRTATTRCQEPRNRLTSNFAAPSYMCNERHLNNSNSLIIATIDSRRPISCSIFNCESAARHVQPYRCPTAHQVMLSIIPISEQYCSSNDAPASTRLVQQTTKRKRSFFVL